MVERIRNPIPAFLEREGVRMGAVLEILPNRGGFRWGFLVALKGHSISAIGDSPSYKRCQCYIALKGWRNYF